MSDSSSHRIGHTAATSNDQNPCVGVARFTCHEWDGLKLLSKHSVEVQVRFDPTTKKWELVGMKEWEGNF